MHRFAVDIYAHDCGAIVDLFGTREITKVAFLLLGGAPQQDVPGLQGQQFVPRDALALTQVNDPHAYTNHARYNEAQSHMQALSLGYRLVGDYDLHAHAQ
jgi:hypothetical protein